MQIREDVSFGCIRGGENQLGKKSGSWGGAELWWEPRFYSVGIGEPLKTFEQGDKMSGKINLASTVETKLLLRRWTLGTLLLLMTESALSTLLLGGVLALLLEISLRKS